MLLCLLFLLYPPRLTPTPCPTSSSPPSLPCLTALPLTPSNPFPFLQVRLQEMRESLRIVYQCINEMPNGLYKSADHKVRGCSTFIHT